jgi:DMSO/TMAO reductase YedYZ molybdopterin-dependent catalytic subunit
VPRIDGASHTLVLQGEGVPEARSFSVEELRHDLPQRTLTVTFACSGNRRREVGSPPHVHIA